MKKGGNNPEFDRHWSKAELQAFARLKRPAEIQAYLDKLPYSCDPIYRSPRSVMRDRTAHCFDGALFAAAALRRIGHPPLMLSLLAVRDDDHMLAIYKQDGCFGAVGKSNCSGLRFREPAYRSLRELVMSYFNDYFNLKGEKTLRGYAAPMNLTAFDHLNWMTSDKYLNRIAGSTDRQKRFRLLTRKTIITLSPIDKRSYQAGFLGAKRAGLYKP
jgi:hypothetical protein